jgi:hypothetical protein
MSYNRINKLKYYKIIQDITKEKYEIGYNTLIGVYEKFIYPIYPISYSHYRKILEEPRLESRLEEEKKRIHDNSQTELF